MPPHPSIRGRGFASAAQELHALLERGRLAPEHVEARLPVRDLELLEAKLEPDDWVPVDSYGRLLDLLAECARTDAAAFHRRRGLEAGERLVEAGAHLPAEGGAAAADGEPWHAPLERLVLAAEGALYSFMDWSLEAAARPGCFVLRLEEAAAFPPAAQHALEGLVAYAAAYLVDRPVTVTSRRPTADQVLVEGRAR